MREFQKAPVVEEYAVKQPPENCMSSFDPSDQSTVAWWRVSLDVRVFRSRRFTSTGRCVHCNEPPSPGVETWRKSHSCEAKRDRRVHYRAGWLPVDDLACFHSKAPAAMSFVRAMLHAPGSERWLMQDTTMRVWIRVWAVSVSWEAWRGAAGGMGDTVAAGIELVRTTLDAWARELGTDDPVPELRRLEPIFYLFSGPVPGQNFWDLEWYRAWQDLPGAENR